MISSDPNVFFIVILEFSKRHEVVC